MIGFLMLTAATSVSADEADAANLAFTQCLFAISREAHAADLSVGAFEQRLATACLAEQRSVVHATAKVLALHGERNAVGAAEGLAEDARRQVIEDYRQALELEPQLRAIGEMCRVHPEQCRE